MVGVGEHTWPIHRVSTNVKRAALDPRFLNRTFDNENPQTSNIRPEHVSNSGSTLAQSCRFPKESRCSTALFTRRCLSIDALSDCFKQLLPADSLPAGNILNLVLEMA